MMLEHLSIRHLLLISNTAYVSPMYILVFTYVCMHIHACIWTYIHTYVCTDLRTCMHTYICVCVTICTYILIPHRFVPFCVVFPVVGGMGFGLMAGALSGINMIQLSGGPGTTGWLQYGSVSLPQSFFIITG